MKILVACKVVPDDQDILIAADGSLDYSKAHQIVSTYDLNALEAAAQIAEVNEGTTVKVISVGSAAIDDSKLKKSILSRGVDELFEIADDSVANLDAYQSAQALKALIAKTDGFDLIICGDGSADNYTQQVDVQLAAALAVPVINGVVKLEASAGQITAERVLETEVQTVTAALPAVVSVSPAIALPRICGMKEILAAGKKPTQVFSAVDAGYTAVTAGTYSIKAPEQTVRKNEIFESTVDGDLDKFAVIFSNIVK
jgi:electron transfer flavoprotein beta subunit